MGLERPLRKYAGGIFLGRGRVLPISDASGTDVDGIGTFYLYPFGYLDFLLLDGTRIANQITDRWTVYPPWESSCGSSRIVHARWVTVPSSSFA
jgi:hypothetical protein